MLTVKQAAERAGISDSLVYEWCSRGVLPHYRLGAGGKRGHIRIDPADLEAFLAACRHQASTQQLIPPLRHIKLV